MPLRPMTTGEILDAATALLRTRGRTLLGLGFLLALLEQAVLFPLRQLADVANAVFPNQHHWDWYWVLLTVGFGTEMCCVAVLAAVSAATARRPAEPDPTTAAGSSSAHRAPTAA
ncbi:hypothetical protein ACFQ0D_30690, partial [Micromonospora zhanjiangensis]